MARLIARRLRAPGSPSGLADRVTRRASSLERGDLRRQHATGAARTTLTNAPGYDDDSAVWSPDGTKIAFVRYFGGAGEIFVMNADGSGQTRT